MKLGRWWLKAHVKVVLLVLDHYARKGEISSKLAAGIIRNGFGWKEPKP